MVDRLAGPVPPRRTRRDRALPLHARPAGSGPPRLPRRQRARFDGHRRAADPRPDEGSGARRRRERRRSARNCTSCSSAPSRSPRKCAARRRSAPTSSRWPLPASIWPSAFSNRSTSQRILFIGAGEMIELCAAHFCATQPKQVTIANRTVERGRALAERYQRHGHPPRRTCRDTGAARHCRFVHRQSAADYSARAGWKARSRRASTGRCSWSTSPCRATSKEVGELDDVFLYTVDDLAHVVENASESRQAAVARPRRIIATPRRSDFLGWLASARHRAGHPLAARFGRAHAPPEIEHAREAACPAAKRPTRSSKQLSQR